MTFRLCPLTIVCSNTIGIATTRPSTMVMSACSTQPEKVTYIEAAKVPEVEPTEKIVKVVKPVPMYGQLKKLPEEDESQSLKKAPWEVIIEANKAALKQPDEDRGCLLRVALPVSMMRSKSRWTMM